LLQVQNLKKTYCFSAVDQMADNPIHDAVLLPIVHPVVDLREVKTYKGNSNNESWVVHMDTHIKFHPYYFLLLRSFIHLLHVAVQSFFIHLATHTLIHSQWHQ